MIPYLLHDAVDHWAAETPDKPAVRCSGEELTYAELSAQTDALAATLAAVGVRRGDRVGIFLHRSLHSAVALYGILKAGAAYVPLDPAMPPARLDLLIRDCEIGVLVTDDRKRRVLGESPDLPLRSVIGPAAGPDLPWRTVPWEQATAEGPPPDVHPVDCDLAYIMYTSGSTGEPKGMMHTHASGLAYACWAAGEYGLRPGDRVSSHSPLHFDISTFDFFASATVGATVVIVPDDYVALPASHAQLLANERVSVVFTVPTALVNLLLRGGIADLDLTALRWVIFGGEQFPLKHLEGLMQALPGARFSNSFGPAETNACVYYHVPPLPLTAVDLIPIGRPCRHADVLVVDESGGRVATGEVGELLVRGSAVTLGYWRRPDLNALAFFERESVPGFRERFYRTGDLVQLAPDGEYRFLGRQDRQAKARGFRVELDEVEVALLSHPEVSEVAVLTLPDGQGSRNIAAAVVARGNGALTEADLRRHAGARLPPYAVPKEIRLVDAFPRTSSGKISRRELEATWEPAETSR